MYRRLVLILLGLALFVCAFGIRSARSSGSGTTQVSYINVGQGDSALIQDPAGFDLLIDGGPSTAGAAVVDYLRGHTDLSLEILLISHPDTDHIGGLIALLQSADIALAQIYYNGYPGTTQTWSDLVALAAARSIPLSTLQFPAELHWGQLDVYVLNPAPGLAGPAANAASVVARIDYNNTCFLFPGDIDSTVEATVIARQTPLASDVLKVAHHGSASSTGAEFLAAVRPTAAVISVGAGNPYGHPSPDTLARLAAAGVQVWRTDQLGTIVMTSDGLTVTFPFLNLKEKVFLPLISAPSPAPPDGANQVCRSSGPARICAWVSNPAPAKYSTVTVYGRLEISNAPQPGQAMSAVWHYKSSTPSCAAVTDSAGLASCARSIGSAAGGFQVNVDVSIAGYTAATWFTPQ